MVWVKIKENKMKYFINYTNEGEILGFAKGDTDLNIEVSNSKWVEGQSYNKIIIDGKNISFDKVDWRTPEEIAEAELERKNAEITRQLETLTVTISTGKTFDANNQARIDLADAIRGAETTKELIDKGVLPADTVWDRTEWRMADNSMVEVTLDELKEASLLAVQTYAKVKGIRE